MGRITKIILVKGMHDVSVGWEEGLKLRGGQKEKAVATQRTPCPSPHVVSLRDATVQAGQPTLHLLHKRWRHKLLFFLVHTLLLRSHIFLNQGEIHININHSKVSDSMTYRHSQSPLSISEIFSLPQK